MGEDEKKREEKKKKEEEKKKEEKKGETRWNTGAALARIEHATSIP